MNPLSVGRIRRVRLRPDNDRRTYDEPFRFLLAALTLPLRRTRRSCRSRHAISISRMGASSSLRPDLAPARRTGQQLAREGFYDGLVFHRVIDGFMAQTGDPGNGTGGSGVNIPAEFTKSHSSAVPWVRHARVTPTVPIHSFHLLCPSTFLNGQYTVWGKVTQEWVRG